MSDPGDAGARAATDRGVGSRDVAIDWFRGLAVWLMLPVNFMEHVAVVPAWLKHAPDVGLTVADLVEPMFVFAIGLTYGTSLARRVSAKGWREAIVHVLRRALALVGIGALFSVGEIGYGFSASGIPWGVLQTIGVAIALALPSLLLPTWVRLGAALSILAAWQGALQAAWLDVVVASPNAGIRGTISWAAVLIMATVFGDLHASRRRGASWALAAALLAGGAALALLFPASKHRMSCSFDLLVCGISAAVFGLAVLLSERSRARLRPLLVWGANPLVLYVSHLFLLAVFLVPAVPWWHAHAPWWLALVQGIAFLAALQAWGAWLYRRGIVVTL